MQNKAKCKLCGDIITSFHSSDYVTCNCGEISLDGGNAMRCFAFKDLANVIRIDDEGNEIVPKIIDNTTMIEIKPVDMPTRSDMLSMLDEMIKSYEALPQSGLRAYCTNSDLCAALILMRAIMACEK